MTPPIFTPTRNFRMGLYGNGNRIPDYQDIRGVVELPVEAHEMTSWNIQLVPLHGADIVKFELARSDNPNWKNTIRDTAPFFSFIKDQPVDISIDVLVKAFDSNDTHIGTEVVSIVGFQDVEPEPPVDPEPPIDPEPPTDPGDFEWPNGFEPIGFRKGDSLDSMRLQVAAERRDIITVENNPVGPGKCYQVHWQRKHGAGLPTKYIGSALFDNRRAEYLDGSVARVFPSDSEFLWTREVFLDGKTCSTPGPEILSQINSNGNPPIDIGVSRDRELRVRTRYRVKGSNSSKSSRTWTFPLEYDKWLKLELFFRMDWKEGGNGYVQFFVNGEELIARTNVRVGYHHTDKTVFLFSKCGIYKNADYRPNQEPRTPERIVYYRNTGLGIKAR